MSYNEDIQNNYDDNYLNDKENYNYQNDNKDYDNQNNIYYEYDYNDYYDYDDNYNEYYNYDDYYNYDGYYNYDDYYNEYYDYDDNYNPESDLYPTNEDEYEFKYNENNSENNYKQYEKNDTVILRSKPSPKSNNQKGGIVFNIKKEDICHYMAPKINPAFTPMQPQKPAYGPFYGYPPINN